MFINTNYDFVQVIFFHLKYTRTALVTTCTELNINILTDCIIFYVTVIFITHITVIELTLVLTDALFCAHETNVMDQIR